jgi:hypothetical protein
VPSGLHPHSHADLSLLQLAIKAFRFVVAMCESPFSTLSTLRIYKRDLLKARVIIQSYNHHVRLLPSRALVGLAITKVYSGRQEPTLLWNQREDAGGLSCSTLPSPVRGKSIFVNQLRGPVVLIVETTRQPEPLSERVDTRREGAGGDPAPAAALSLISTLNIRHLTDSDLRENSKGAEKSGKPKGLRTKVRRPVQEKGDLSVA